MSGKNHELNFKFLAKRTNFMSLEVRFLKSLKNQYISELDALIAQ